MAKVMFNGKTIPIVTSIRISDIDKDKGVIVLTTPINGEKVEITFNKNSTLRIVQHGSVDMLNTNTNVTVFGIVKKAAVQGNLKVEGFIYDCVSPNKEIKVDIDESIKIVEPKEERKLVKNEGTSRAKILYIYDNLQQLNIDSKYNDIELLVRGVCDWLHTHKNLYVRGEVKKASVYKKASQTNKYSTRKNTNKPNKQIDTAYTHKVNVTGAYDLIKLNIPHKVCEKIDLLAKKLNLNILALSYVSHNLGCVDIITDNRRIIISMYMRSHGLMTEFKVDNPRLKQIKIIETDSDFKSYLNKCERTNKSLIYTNDFTTQIKDNKSTHLIQILQTALEHNLDYTMIIHEKGNWAVEVQTKEWFSEPHFIVHYNSNSTGYSCSRAEVSDGCIKCDLKLTKEVSEKIYKFWSETHK